MLKKTLFIMVLIGLFLNSFAMFSDAFSQPNIRLRAIKNQNNTYIRILTPTNIKRIRVEIFSVEDELKATINREYYGIIEEQGIYNEFIISNTNINFDDEDTIRVLPNTRMEVSSVISAIPYKNMDPMEEKLERPLKVMTYNIHRGKDKVGNETLKGIRELIQKEDPDIIGLQEVDKNMIRTNFRDQLKELADELSMYYVYGPNFEILKGQYGNGILSKYPIVEAKNIKMDGKETRGVLMGKISIDGINTSFMVTHLGLNEDERANQFKVIEHYIEMESRQVILVGDFNTLDQDHNIVSLENKLNDVGGTTKNKHLNTFNVFRNENRIDYIYVPKNSKVLSYKVHKVDYSDHFPVMAEIIIR